MGMLIGGKLFKREVSGYADGRGLVQEGNCMGMQMGGDLFKRGIVWVC